MADDEFRILHPRNKEKVNNNNFAAYGLASDTTGPLIGVITDEDGDEIATANSIVDPPNWVMSFEGVPDGDWYRLEVSEAKAPDDPLGSSEGWKVKHLFGGVVISHPDTSAHLCTTTFTSYGTTTDLTCITASLTSGSGQPKTVQGPCHDQHLNWIVQFTNVTKGSGQTLTVKNATTSASVDNLDIEPTYCT